MDDVVGERHRLEAALLGAHGELEQVVGVVERGRDDELHAELRATANVPRLVGAGAASGRISRRCERHACSLSSGSPLPPRWRAAKSIARAGAARFGAADAQLALGERLASGDGIERNFDEALGWLEKAAEQGSPPAQLRLVDLYAERNAGEDAARAERWLRAAAEAGERARSSSRPPRAAVTLREAASGSRRREAGDPRGLLAQARARASRA